MIGFLTGILTKLFFLGFALVEAFIFMIAFNFLAPTFSEKIVSINVTHVTYWESFAIFVLAHLIGGLIQSLTPKIVNLNNTNGNE